MISDLSDVKQSPLNTSVQGYALFEVLPDAGRVKPSIRVRETNEAFFTITGLSPDQIKEKDACELWQGDRDPFAGRSPYIPAGSREHFTWSFHPTGKQVHVELIGLGLNLTAAFFTEGLSMEEDILETTFRKTGVRNNVDPWNQVNDEANSAEKRLSSAMEIARLGSWKHDMQTGLFTFTDNLYSIYHTTAREMGGYQMTAEEYSHRFVHPEEKDLVANEIRMAIESKEPNFSRYLEHRFLYADGGTGHLAVRFFVVRDEKGKTVMSYGVNQDITAQKQASEEIRWRNEDLLLINAINNAVNHNAGLEELIDLIADNLKRIFNSHFCSVHLPGEKQHELVMYGSRVDNRISSLVERVMGRPIPPIRIKRDVADPFDEIELTGKGVLLTEKMDIVRRLEKFLPGTPWHSMVQSMIRPMLPMLCDLMEYRSSISVPMISAGDIVGFMEIGSRNILTEKDLQRIQTIADHLATVVVKFDSEKKLRNIEQQMTSAFRYAAIGMAFVSTDGRWLRVNPAVPAMLGYTEDELLSKTFQEITHPEDLQKDLDYVLQMLEGTIQTYQMEKRYVHKSGAIVWAWLSVSLVRDTEGRPLHFISQIQDITERKLAEEALYERETRFRHLFEAMAQGVVYQDDNGAITLANPAAERILGLSLAQMQGRTSIDPRWHSIHEDGSPYPGETHPAMVSLSTGQKSSAVMGVFNPERQDYTWINVNSIPEFRNNERKPFQVFTTFEDVTELKKAFKELEKAKELSETKVQERTHDLTEINNFLQAIISAIPDLLFRISREGIYLDYLSQDVSKLYVSPEHFIGKSIREVLPHDLAEQSMDALNEAFIKKEIVQYNYSLSAGNSLRHYENRIIAISPDQVLSIIRDITDRQEAVRELQETMQKLINLIRNLQAGTLFETEERKISLVNQAFCDMFKIPASPEMLVGYDCEEAATASMPLMREPEKFITRVRELVSERNIAVNDELYLTDGRVLERDYIPIIFEEKLLGHLWQYRDITPRKEAEAALKMQSAAFEAFVLPIIITGSDGRIRWANSSFSALSGYDMQEILGQTPGSLQRSGKQDSAYYRQLWDTISNRKVWKGELINRRKDGSLYYEEEVISPVLDWEGNISGYIAIKLDITERKATQMALQEKTRELETFFSVVPDLLCIADKEGNFIKVNKSWEVILGYPAEELEKMKFLDFLHPEDLEKTTVSFSSLQDQKISPVLINRYRNKEGEYRFFEWKLVPFGNYVYAAARDVTERENLERSLKEAIAKEKELSDLKSRFVSMVSHEFRTPLASILAASETVASYWDRMNPEQRALRFQKITSQVARLTSYIQDMLHFTKLQSKESLLTLKTFDLVELFRQIIEEHNEITGNSGRILFHADTDALEVFLDREEVNSIIDNLLSNALKYSPVGKPVEINLYTRDKELVFTVSDEGIGIPEKDLGHLFEPFFRASNSSEIPGTGLGLPIVKEAIEKHGGSISLKSVLNHGTEFTVTLPVMVEGAEE